MKYCPYCGAGLDADMRFCPKCGKPFEESKENPHITGKHVKKEPADYAESTYSFPLNDEPKKRKHGGIIALVIAVVLIGLAAGLYFGGVFKPKEEPIAPFSDNTAAIAEASNSVVMLNCYDKDGEMYATASGFVVFEDSVIVTNYHVIEQDAYRVTAQTEKGDSFDCPTVLAWDADKDIAILKAERHTGLSLLTPGSTGNLQKGEKVVAIGSPLGLINSVSTGVFSGFVSDDAGTTLQFTAAISHGSSGGALFNDAGEVIGVTFATLQDGQNINLAVPIEDVAGLYEKSKSTNPINIESFYNSFTHTPPITIYSVDEILAHSNELDQQEFLVEGYISAIEDENNPSYSYYRLYLVDSPDKVIGEYITNSYTEIGQKVIAEMNRNEVLVAYPSEGLPEGLMRKYKTGDHIILSGKLEYQDLTHSDWPRDIRRSFMYATEIDYYSQNFTGFLSGDSLPGDSPIPSYTVGYVLEHYKELDGETMYIEGYVSSVLQFPHGNSSLDYTYDYSVFVVDSINNVSGYNANTGNINDDFYSSLNGWSVEADKQKDYQCICINFTPSDISNEIVPKNKVSLPCQLKLSDSDSKGNRLEAGNRLVFTYLPIEKTKNTDNPSAPSYTINYVMSHYKELDGQKISVNGFLSSLNMLFETAEQVKDDYLADYHENHDNASFVAGMQQNIDDNKVGLNLHGTGNVDLSSYAIGDCIRVTGVCHVNMTVYGELGYVSMDVESVDLINHRE